MISGLKFSTIFIRYDIYKLPAPLIHYTSIQKLRNVILLKLAHNKTQYCSFDRDLELHEWESIVWNLVKLHNCALSEEKFAKMICLSQKCDCVKLNVQIFIINNRNTIIIILIKLNIDW